MVERDLNLRDVSFAEEQVRRFNTESLRANPILNFDIDFLKERLSKNPARILGIDIGGSKATLAEILLDEGLEAKWTDVQRSELAEKGLGFMLFLRLAGEYAKTEGIPVGISTAGVVEGTRLMRTSHLPALKGDLDEYYDGDFAKAVPTLKTVVNDAAAGTIASFVEAKRRYPGARQVINLIIGSGFGGAVLKDDTIWSMEPGHIQAIPELNPYDERGLCVLSNTESSCLHMVTSGIGLANTYRRLTGNPLPNSPENDELAQELYENSAIIAALSAEGIGRTFGMFQDKADTVIAFHGGVFNSDTYRNRVTEILSERLNFEPQTISTKDFSKNACLDGAVFAAAIAD